MSTADWPQARARLEHELELWNDFRDADGVGDGFANDIRAALARVDELEKRLDAIARSRNPRRRRPHTP